MKEARIIDCRHLGTLRAIGCWLMPGEEPVIVDPGPGITVNTVLGGLKDQGIGLGDLKAVLLTHIHLDHAGAAGRLVELYPDLSVYVHEIGAAHMADPERLLASAGRLYGDTLEEVWGEFLPVPERNLRPLSGGERLEFGNRVLRVEYTPGHASHHVCYFDESDGAAYVGDVAGVRIPPSEYVVPPTPPPDLDIEEWNRSLAIVEAWEPEVIRMTHFGEYRSYTKQLNELREALARWGERVGVSLDGDEIEAIEGFRKWMGGELRQRMGHRLARSYEQVAPADQLWLGLARYWRKRNTPVR